MSGRGFGLAAIAAIVALGGCVTKPTNVREQPERKMEAAERMLEPIVIAPDTLVVDARPRFDYSLAHIPRSVSVQWADFTEPERDQRGVLQGDLFAAARRLARYGISPTSKVVVVGRGRDGDGEEGRVAWMLAYLGVADVKFADVDSFKTNLTNIVDEGSAKPAATWKPEPIESLNVERKEVQYAINSNAMHEPASYEGAPAVLYRLIDVRPVGDYLGREGFGARSKVPNMGAINIPWLQFFDADLRPLPSMQTKLREVGVLPEHRVLVIGADGVSSAAVTMALRALGYKLAGNYAGGLTDLMSAYPLSR